MATLGDYIKSRSLKRRADASVDFATLAGGGGGGTRTVYTMGPPLGDYDVEWATDNAGAGAEWYTEADKPKITTVNGRAEFGGVIVFVDAFPDPLFVTLPVQARPAAATILLVNGYDASANAFRQASLTFDTASGVMTISFVDGSDWGQYDEVSLSGGYLLPA